MSVKMVLLLLAGCASVAGCAGRTVEDLAANCDAYGFQRGTVDWSHCVQAEVMAYNQGQQDRAWRLNAAGAALMQQGQAMNARAAYRQPQYVVPYQPVVNCRRNAWGVQCR